MRDGEIKSTVCKYVFDESEKKEIAQQMALEVDQLKIAQNEKKAAASDYKSRIDALEANISRSATRLNNGYEMRSMDCRIRADWDQALWLYIREDNNELVREERMTANDKQRRIDNGL